jgi:hypothetical protein
MRKPGVPLSAEQCEQIVRLTAAGYKADDVAGLVGCSRRSVFNVLKDSKAEVAAYRERLNPDTLTQMEILRAITQDNQPACPHCHRSRTTNAAKISASRELRAWALGLMRDEIEEEMTQGLIVGPPRVTVYAEGGKTIATFPPQEPSEHDVEAFRARPHGEVYEPAHEDELRTDAPDADVLPIRPPITTNDERGF